jgi:hypothetical protein
MCKSIFIITNIWALLIKTYVAYSVKRKAIKIIENEIIEGIEDIQNG